MASGWKLGIPTLGGGDLVGGVGQGGGVCIEEAEYSRAVHYDATDYGPLQGNSAETRGVGRKNVVGSGGTGPGGR